MGLVPYGSEHKRRRQVLAQALNPRAIQNDFFPVQERYSRQLAKALFDDPDDFINHIRRYVSPGVDRHFALLAC